MLNTLIKISGRQLLIPLYHSVCDYETKHIKNLYINRNTNQFKNDIDYILKYYDPIDVEFLVEIVHGREKLKKNSVLFTFDDGLREVNDIIIPILKQKGIPAAFFVNTDFVDNKDLFYRYKASLLVEKIKSNGLTKNQLKEFGSICAKTIQNESEICKCILDIDYNSKTKLDEIAGIIEYDFKEFLKIEQPYLTLSQLKDLKSQGYHIGAHSIDHPEYYKIPYDGQLRQTTKSIEWVKRNLEQEYNVFAFPFTDFKVSKKFFEKIYSSKKPLFDLSFGCAGIKDDYHAYHLQRLPMEVGNKSAKTIITQEYRRYLLKKLIGENCIRRK